MVTQNTISNSEQNPEEYFKNRKLYSIYTYYKCQYRNV